MSRFEKRLPWPEKPVYQISVDGVKACLLSDGRVMGWTNGFGDPDEVGRLEFSDSGRPWIPKHKNFNSLVKQMFREGDFDGLLAFRRNRKMRQASMKAAAPELYEALDQAITSMQDSGYQNDHVVIRAGRAALAKARGES